MSKTNKGIDQIVYEHKQTIDMHQYKLDKLRSEAVFCSEHKFEEERRILSIKIDSMDTLLYEYKNLYNAFESYIKHTIQT